MRERFGSRLHLLVVAREEHTHVGADTGGHVEPCHRLFRSLGAASIGTRDDDEIFVSLVAGDAGIFDLGDEILARDRVRDIFVVMRPLGIKLILDMDAGDAGADEFAHRAHGV